jgi:hypothetical protein
LIACPAVFHFHFIPAWPLISLLPHPISFPFHFCLAFNFISAWPLISLPAQLYFTACLAFNFIAYPAVFHCHFISAWPLISLPAQLYFIAISFLACPLISLLPHPISFLTGL